jgi:hypothetical protein
MKKVEKIPTMDMLYNMDEKKRLREIEAQIEKIKNQLVDTGDMRPGSLTKQYRDPKKQLGPFYQLSYTHKMKSRTEYVRPLFVEKIKLEIMAYKRFKKLTERWIDLAIEKSKLQIQIDKNKISE